MKNEKGITLIALVITIIVLLIISGISIAMLSGDNSILQKAADAKEITEQRKEEEKEVLDQYGRIINSFQEEKEIHLTNYTELLNFADRVNSGESLKNYTIYLDNDITIEDDEWVMIGYFGGRDDPSMTFEGDFDGNNHTIKGIKLGSSRYKGFFYENAGTIKNLNIEVTAETTSGCIAGGVCSNNTKNIFNCSVNIVAKVNSGMDNLGPSIGGISGMNYGTIEHCIVSGKIEGAGNYLGIGGISGDNSGAGIIRNCKNEAHIVSNGSKAGGIAGENGGQILQCINTGELELSSGNCGGIAGEQTYEHRNNRRMRQ